MGLLTAISHRPSPSPPPLAPSLSSQTLTFESSSCLRFPQPSLSGFPSFIGGCLALTVRGGTALRSTLPASPTLVSSFSDLFDFICAGPLMKQLGFTAETVAESIDNWITTGVHLCQLFRLDDLSLSPPERARIYHFYVPVFLWCQEQLKRHRTTFGDDGDVPPLVIGVSAPQGSGKTTLVFALDYLFRQSGRRSATLSIDDFYLTAEDQAKLRNQNPSNALLEVLKKGHHPPILDSTYSILQAIMFRGNAGSHDLQFSIDTLTSLKKLTKNGTKMKLPRYDKSAYGGRGDRADPSTWPEVEGPLEVILFEGWMLGFKPLPNDAVNAVDPQLQVVNENLKAYYDAWDKFVEAWIIIKIKDPNCVYQWRLQAEVAMREDGKPGMSDEEVFDFVSRYLPAYTAYLPTLYTQGPKGLDPDRLLVIEIDEERNPISAD